MNAFYNKHVFIYDFQLCYAVIVDIRTRHSMLTRILDIIVLKCRETR